MMAIFISARALSEDEKPAGGLAVALRNTIEKTGGHWFCIEPNKEGDSFKHVEEQWRDIPGRPPIITHKILVPAKMYEGYYAYGNKLAWTVNHDRPDLSRFTQAEQVAYARVLDYAADVVNGFMRKEKISEDPVWVHDFLLAGIGLRLKERFNPEDGGEKIQSKLLFHLHTPVAGVRAIPLTDREEFERTGKTFNPGGLVQQFSVAGQQPSVAKTWDYFNPAPGDNEKRIEEKRDIKEACLNFDVDMTYFDSITFQTEKECAHFMEALNIQPETGMDFPRFGAKTITYKGRTFSVMNAPISVPTQKILQQAFSAAGLADDIVGKWQRIKNSFKSKEGKELLDQLSEQAEYIIYTGAERGDFSKGIVERARQYYLWLRDNPEMRGRVQMMQVMIPTRSGIDGGKNEYAKVEEEAHYWHEKINREFGTADFKPFILHTKMLPNDEAILLSQAIRFVGGRLHHAICLIGAIRDGMNLTVGECMMAQDPAYPAAVFVPSTIGAVQEAGAFTYTYDPEQDNAFSDVMKRAVKIFKDKDLMKILRDIYHDAKVYMLDNDLMNWAARCLATVWSGAKKLLGKTANLETPNAEPLPRQLPIFGKDQAPAPAPPN